MAYDMLPLAARLNIAADFLATRYRQHGRLRAIEMIDHKTDHQVSIYINRLPVTSQHDDCIRFHVNRYHHQNYVQQHHGWDNCTWESIDFYTFGKHFKRLRPLHQVQHFKFIHDQLPLGDRRYREAPIKDELLKLFPCCRDTEESPLHFTGCKSTPIFQSSLDTLRSDILTSDSHPVRYLLVNGFCHTINSDTPYAPPTAQFPSHFQDLISEALDSQLRIGWNNSLKGYFSRSWGQLAQYNDMHRNVRDSQKGEQWMKQISTALSDHFRRLCISRNGVLHSPNDATLESIPRSAEAIEITYYHSRPHLLRTGDQHYCSRPLSVILNGTAANRRRWLRKVKTSSAELTKDGTRQTLITNFFAVRRFRTRVSASVTEFFFAFLFIKISRVFSAGYW